MKFIRMQEVDAVPMTRGEYDESLKSEDRVGEDRTAAGYRVTAADGRVSWMPKEEFENGSLRCTAYGDPDAPKYTVPFGFAILQCVHGGRRISRLGWNGEDQYVEFRTAEVGYPERSAFEQSTCLVFHFRNRHTGEAGIQVGWLASQADLKAEDWVVLGGEG